MPCRYALDKLGREQMPELYTNFIAFEKKHGNREGIEEVIVGKRRLQYEEAVAESPHNYDAWFDYVRLEEEEGDHDRVREVYERAVAQVYFLSLSILPILCHNVCDVLKINGRCPQFKKSDFGVVTFIFGSITLCLRS